jgi:hypothetical protein
MTKSFIILLSIFILLGVANSAFAQVWSPGDPLVPCGTSTTPLCQTCDLFKLAHNIIYFMLYIMVPIAVLLFVFAGFLILLGGANPGLIGRGKVIFTNTFYGVIIILASFMITNSIIQSLAPSGLGSGTSWWEFQCSEPFGGPPVDPPPSVTCSDLPALAASNNVPFPRTNSPALAQMMFCVQSNSSVTSLIDSSKTFTYGVSGGDPISGDSSCNYTRGNPVCSSCAHSVNSCHFGGATGSNGAEAADYNARSGVTEQQLCDAIMALWTGACSSDIGFVICESDHTHVSTVACDGN